MQDLSQNVQCAWTSEEITTSEPFRIYRYQHAFRGQYLSSFRLSLIINPIHLFITLQHWNTQVSYNSPGINTRQRARMEIPPSSICLFVNPQAGETEEKPHLAFVHFTCKTSNISIFPWIPGGQNQRTGEYFFSCEVNWFTYCILKKKGLACKY